MNKSLIYSCVLACLSLLLYSQQLSGQSNIKVGYMATYYRSSQYNAITKNWSDANQELSSLYGLGLSHGIDIGFRKRNNNFLWNLSYSIALGGSDTKLLEDQDLNIAFVHHMLGAGIGSQMGKFAVGTDVLFNLMSYSGTQEPQDKTGLDKDQYFSSRIFLSYTLNESGQQRLAFEPFVDIPWDSGKPLTETAEFLGVDPNTESSTPLIIGLRIILLNGSF